MGGGPPSEDDAGNEAAAGRDREAIAGNGGTTGVRMDRPSIDELRKVREILRLRRLMRRIRAKSLDPERELSEWAARGCTALVVKFRTDPSQGTLPALEPGRVPHAEIHAGLKLP